MNTLKLELNQMKLSPGVVALLESHNLFEGVMHDQVTTEAILSHLDDRLLIQVAINNEFAGFFSLEDLGKFSEKRVVEVHAYLLPHMRKYSLLTLAHMRDFIFASTSFDVILTSSRKELRHVHLLLKRIGFTLFDEKEVPETFNGKPIIQTHYYLNKTEG